MSYDDRISGVQRHRQMPTMQSDGSFWIFGIRTVERSSIVALILQIIHRQDVSFRQLANERAKLREIVA